MNGALPSPVPRRVGDGTLRSGAWSRRLAVAAVAGASITTGVHLHRRWQHKGGVLPGRPLRVPRLLMEALFGAVGEITQVAVVYPIDTIKVRCQASGLGAAAVLRGMLASQPPMRVLAQLYAGVIASSLCSVAIGSLYFLTFCAAQRMAGNVAAKLAASKAAAVAAAAAAVQVVVVDGGAALGAVPSAKRRGRRRQDGEAERSAAAAAAAATAAAAAAAPAADGGLAVNITAAVAAALVGALIEAPVELFKNQTKAGLLQGDMLHNMGAALRTNGLRGWYWGFLPFCIKSFPFDVGELVTWGQLRDWKHSMQTRHAAAQLLLHPGGTAASPPHVPHAPPPMLVSSGVVLSLLPDDDGAVAELGGLSHSLPGGGTAVAGKLSVAELWLVENVPDQLWDAVIGAAAGAAAVAVSMPGDCIKTHMDTRCAHSVQPGGWRSVNAFFKTGSNMVAKHGAGALYTGMWPRMCGMVPSTALYWIAVEGCRRMAEPYMEDEAPSGAAAAAGAAGRTAVAGGAAKR